MCRRIAVLLTLAALGFDSHAAAQDQPAKESTALKFIPADSGLFFSFLRWGEQAAEFVESKAYQTLVDEHEFPTTLREAVDLLAEKGFTEEQLEQWNTFWAEEENEALFALVEDMLSQEVVYHADNGLAATMVQFNQFSADQNRYQADLIGRITAGDFDARTDDLGRIYLKHLKTLEPPGQTLAFRLSDADAANAQIARLEKMFLAVAGMQPDLAKAMSRQKINGAEFLTLQLHGGMIPKEALEASEFSAEMQAELLAALKEKKVVAAIGVWNDYLVVHVGATLAGLEKLGTGPLLVDRPEFARLKQAGAKPFTSVQFASAELMRAATNDSSAFESTLRMIPSILRATGGEDEAVKDVETDIAKLSQELDTPAELFGPNAYFSYRIPGGYEEFDLDWTKDPGVDGTKPLTILEHVGGSPLFFFAGRSKMTGVWYDRLSYWVVRIMQHSERFSLNALPMDDDAKEEYGKVRVEVEQILRRFDEITRTNLLPAMKDGQYALVLDAKLKEKEWVKGAPSEEPLAAPEVAVAVGINQVGLFRQAGEDYLRLAQESVKRLSEFAQSPIPKDFEIPAPEKREFPEGIVYYYRAAADWLNAKFAPNVGLSDQFAVFSLFPQQSKRMLAATPLADPELLADGKKPRAYALQIQVAAAVDLAEAWMEYAAAMSPEAPADDDAEEEEEESFLEQARPFLQLLRGLKSVTAETTIEDGVSVTHSVWRLAD